MTERTDWDRFKEYNLYHVIHGTHPFIKGDCPEDIKRTLLACLVPPEWSHEEARAYAAIGAVEMVQLERDFNETEGDA